MKKLLSFPNWNTNPYSNLLYLEARAEGWDPFGGVKFSDLMADLKKVQEGDVVHIQWTSPFGDQLPKSETYESRIERFEIACVEAKGRGVRIVWTVHNVLAHGTQNAREEIHLAEVLCELADRIVILNPFTVEVAAPFYRIPKEKVVRVPHASYKGIYAAAPDRAQVEENLGIPQGLTTFGVVGAVRAYKGTFTFLEAGRKAVQNHGGAGLVLAGETNPWLLRQIDSRVTHDYPFFRHHSKLTDDELALWMGACDVIVLPYDGILNSGSMHLAATYGIPVVLPALDHLVKQFEGEYWIEFFDLVEGDALVDSVAGAILRASADRPERRAAALSYADAYTPYDMARDFNKLLSNL